MNEALILPLFGALFGMVLVWFVLVNLLFNRLAQAHSQTYEAMGSPSLFLRNTPSGVFAMLKFVLVRQHRVLKDSYLSNLSDVMLIFFLVYLVGFFVLLFVVGSQAVAETAA